LIYLALALWAEGPSDGPFLRPVLRRAVVDAALRSRGPVDVAEEFIRLPPNPAEDATRDERICRSVNAAGGAVSILFIHTDGGGQPERAREQRVQPAIARIVALTSAPACVAVVPRQETEARMLADVDAVAYALGVNPSRLEDFPRLDEVERLSDPKRRLEDIRSTVPLDEGRLHSSISGR
jgi:hypothetical protein